MKLSEIGFLMALCIGMTVLCLYGWLVAGYGPLVLLPPVGIAAVVVPLGVVRGVLTLTLRSGDGQAALLRGYWRELRGTIGGLLWCLSVLPLLLLLGYPIGLSVFATLYARSHGAQWVGSLLAGAFAFAVCWGGAGKLLGVPVALVPGWWA